MVGLALITVLRSTNGYLQAFENGQEIGWISSAWNIFGENGLTMDLDARMVVQIDLIDAETGAADIKTVVRSFLLLSVGNIVNERHRTAPTLHYPSWVG